MLKLPLVVTTTAARSMWGPTIPELAEVLRSDGTRRHRWLSTKGQAHQSKEALEAAGMRPRQVPQRCQRRKRASRLFRNYEAELKPNNARLIEPRLANLLSTTQPPLRVTDADTVRILAQKVAQTASSEKRKCPPEGEHFLTPVTHRGMYMGESDPTVSQPPKPVCDWILGFRTGEVKQKSPRRSAP